jgi:dihydroflavonol-4-reductase
MSKVAFVTGATGQLGSNLVHLLLEQGWQVRALARSQDKAHKILGNTNAEIIIGDMEDVVSFASALQGVDTVFHTAAYFHEYYAEGNQQHWDKLKKINVDGTQQLIEYSYQAQVKNFIYTSSSGVIGSTNDGSPSNETTPHTDLIWQNLYFRSKLQSEQFITTWVKTHPAMSIVIILPSVIIGAGDNVPTAAGKSIISISQGKLTAIVPGGFEYVDSRDVAQAMISAVDKGRSGERYIISEGYHSIAEMVEVVSKICHVPLPSTRLNYTSTMLLAWVSEISAWFTGKPPAITRITVRTMCSQHPTTTQKAQSELGITYRSFEESLNAEIIWFKETGYI